MRGAMLAVVMCFVGVVNAQPSVSKPSFSRPRVKVRAAKISSLEKQISQIQQRLHKDHAPNLVKSAGGPDAGGPGAGGPDAGGPDAGGPDAGGPDAGGPDAGGPDTGGPVASHSSHQSLPASNTNAANPQTSIPIPSSLQGRISQIVGTSSSNGNGPAPTPMPTECSSAEIAAITAHIAKVDVDAFTAHLAAGRYIAAHGCHWIHKTTQVWTPAPTPNAECTTRNIAFGLIRKGMEPNMAKYVAAGGVGSAIAVKGGTVSDYCVSAPTKAPTQTPTSASSYPTPAPTRPATLPPLPTNDATGSRKSATSKPPTPLSPLASLRRMNIKVVLSIICGVALCSYCLIGLEYLRSGTKQARQKGKSSKQRKGGNAAEEMSSRQDEYGAGAGGSSTQSSYGNSSYNNDNYGSYGSGDYDDYGSYMPDVDDQIV